MCCNLNYLKVIGCVAFCHIPSKKQNKLEPKSMPTILIRYDENSKTYCCFNLATRKIIISQFVCFDERSCNLGTSKTIEPLLDKLPHPINEEPANTENTAPMESNINHKTQLNNEGVTLSKVESKTEVEILPLQSHIEPLTTTSIPIVRSSH